MERNKTVPEWAERFFIEWGSVEYDDVLWDYAVLKRDLKMDLVGFMGFIPDIPFLFISEDVPKKWRRYVLRHELREHLGLGHAQERCVVSLITELQEVPVSEIRDYTRWRINFFRRLIEFYTKEPHPDPSFMGRIKASFNHLRVREMVVLHF